MARLLTWLIGELAAVVTNLVGPGPIK